MDNGDEAHALQSTDDPGCVSSIDAGASGPSIDGGVEEGEPDADLVEVDASIPPTPAKPSIFVSIKANGTGCPAGANAFASITPSGDSFLMTFDGFEAQVDKNKSVDIKNCQLGIKLKSDDGVSFTLNEIAYEGYAFLSRGQSARVLMKTYFQGQPAKNQREVGTNLSGPFDDTYTFQDTIGIVDAIWSPCGAQRDLQINTTLRLQNGAKDQANEGYINLGKIHRLKLGWKKCQ